MDEARRQVAVLALIMNTSLLSPYSRITRIGRAPSSHKEGEEDDDDDDDEEEEEDKDQDQDQDE